MLRSNLVMRASLGMASIAWMVVAACHPMRSPCVADRGCPAPTLFEPCSPAQGPSIDVRAVGAVAPGTEPESPHVRVAGLLVPANNGVCTLLACGGGCCNQCWGGLALADFESGATIPFAAQSDERWTCNGDESSVCCRVPTDVPVIVEARLISEIQADGTTTALAVESVCGAAMPESPTPATFRVPTQLRLVVVDARPAISYAPADTEPLTLTHSRGAFLGARIRRDDGSVSLGGVRPLLPPDDPNPVDGLHDYRGGALHRTYTFEIFETTEPPGHEWTPERRGYRILWSRTIPVHFEERDVRAMGASF